MDSHCCDLFYCQDVNVGKLCSVLEVMHIRMYPHVLTFLYVQTSYE